MSGLTDELSAAGWRHRHELWGIGLGLLAMVVTRQAWLDIAQAGLYQAESSHVLLAPIAAAWIVWVWRDRLSGTVPRGHWLGPLALLAAWGAHSVGFHYSIQALWHGGAVALPLACLVAAFGIGPLVRLWPAVLVLGFLVPVPGTVREWTALPLMTATATVSETLLFLLGVEVTRAGNVLTVAGQDVAVAEACNGARMVFALTIVAWVVAFIHPYPSYARALMIVGSPLLALAANVARLVPTVWLYGHLPDVTAKTFHDLTGWAMVPVAFLALLGLVRLGRWVAEAPDAHGRRHQGPRPIGGSVETTETQK